MKIDENSLKMFKEKQTALNSYQHLLVWSFALRLGFSAMLARTLRELRDSWCERDPCRFQNSRCGVMKLFSSIFIYFNELFDMILLGTLQGKHLCHRTLRRWWCLVAPPFWPESGVLVRWSPPGQTRPASQSQFETPWVGSALGIPWAQVHTQIVRWPNYKTPDEKFISQYSDIATWLDMWSGVIHVIPKVPHPNSPSLRCLISMSCPNSESVWKWWKRLWGGWGPWNLSSTWCLEVWGPKKPTNPTRRCILCRTRWTHRPPFPWPIVWQGLARRPTSLAWRSSMLVSSFTWKLFVHITVKSIQISNM